MTLLLLLSTLAAALEGTCDGYCGTASPDGCWCDEFCTTYGDCCDDYTDECVLQEGTCEGSCGTQSPDGCWCDDLCTLYGDCCGDYTGECQVCPSCGTEDYPYLGSFGGSALSLAGDDNYVYAGVGANVHIFDRLAGWAEVGRYDVGDKVRQIKLDGTTATIVAGWEGIHIVDVTDPTQPVAIGTYDPPLYPRDAAWTDTALVVVGEGGVASLDLTVPDAPWALLPFDIYKDHASVALHPAGYAYASVLVDDDGCKGDVGVFNVSGPSPAFVRTLRRPGCWNVETNDIVYLDDRMYVAHTEGLAIYDTTDPSTPVKLGQTPGSEWTDPDSGITAFTRGITLSIEGTQIHMSNSTTGALPTTGVFTIDASDPTAPVFTDFAAMGSDQLYAFDVHLGRVAMAADDGGVWDMSLADPSDKVPLLYTGALRGMQVQGDVAYLADFFTGMLIVDVSDPWKPRPLGTYVRPGYETERPSGAGPVQLLDNDAILGRGCDGIEVVDVSDPYVPYLKDVFVGADHSEIGTPHFMVGDVQPTVGRAYIAGTAFFHPEGATVTACDQAGWEAMQRTFTVLDVNAGEETVLLHEVVYDTRVGGGDHIAYDLQVSGNLALYLGNRVIAWDLGPEVPERVCVGATCFWSLDLEAKDPSRANPATQFAVLDSDHLAMGSVQGTLAIYDISGLRDRSAPAVQVWQDANACGGWIGGLEAEGTTLYVHCPQVTGGGELRLYDLTDPSAPLLVHSGTRVPGASYGLHRYGDRIFLPASDHGLWILGDCPSCTP